MSGHILSLDLGTSYCKAAVYEATGHVLDAARAPLLTRHPQPGWAEQDAADWIWAVERALGDLDGRAKKAVRAIGLSSQKGSVLYLNRNGQPVCPAILHSDSRAAHYRARLMELKLVDKLGLNLVSVLPRMMWTRAHRPEVLGQAVRVCGAKEYVGLWLTGAFATDFSSGPGLHGWPNAALQLAGLSPEATAPICPPTAILGRLTARAAEGTGLPAGTPVVLGAADGACANLGTGATEPGSACISLSTTGAVRLASTSIPSPSQIAAQGGFAYALDRKTWLWGGLVTTAGGALDWLAAVLDGQASVETLISEAEGIPVGSDGLVFTPYFQGMYGPRLYPEARGRIHGMSLSHGRAHLVRAVMEGVVCSMRAVIEGMGVLGAEVRTGALTGGCAASRLWRQMVVDMLDLELAYRSGGTALGAAILAAVGTGLYPDIPTAQRNMLHSSEFVAPGPARAEYEALYSSFRRVAEIDQTREMGGQ